MKRQLYRILSIGFFAALIISNTQLYAFQTKSLSIGAKVPSADQKMQDVSGRSLSLNEVIQENGLLVIFSSNTCPWIMKWEDRFTEVSGLTRENRIGMIALNPNENSRDKGDGLDDMIKRSQKAAYDFPYVLDKNHIVADAFGANRTPHVFLFNGNSELVYVGAIDDNANNEASVKHHYLKDAIDQLISGQQLSNPETKSIGCTIKRGS